MGGPIKYEVGKIIEWIKIYAVIESYSFSNIGLQRDNGICFIQKQLPEVLIHLSHWQTTRRSIPVL